MLELCQKHKKRLLTLFHMKNTKSGAILTRGVAWKNEHGANAIVEEECVQWFVAFRLQGHIRLVASLISQMLLYFLKIELIFYLVK